MRSVEPRRNVTIITRENMSQLSFVRNSSRGSVDRDKGLAGQSEESRCFDTIGTIVRRGSLCEIEKERNLSSRTYTAFTKLVLNVCGAEEAVSIFLAECMARCTERKVFAQHSHLL